MKTKLLAVCLCLLLLFTALDPQILAADADGVGGTPDGGADEALDGGEALDGAGMGAAASGSGSYPVMQNNVSITPAPDYMVTIEIYFPQDATFPIDDRFTVQTEMRIVILDAFEFPDAGDVKLFTATRDSVTGEFGDPQLISAPSTEALLTVTPADKKISVTNYDFSAALTDKKKLIIQYPNVPKTVFLGGNAVDFLKYQGAKNICSGYVYMKNNKEFFVKFDLVTTNSKVNVPIPEIVVDPLCKNVYAGVPVTAAELKSGAKAYVKGDPHKVNILALDSDEKWRKNRVTVTPEIYYPDPDDNIKGLPAVDADPFSFKQDTVYALNVKIEPNIKIKNSIPTNTPPAAAGGGANAVNIFVYKPVVTFQDLTNVYYGDEANLAAAYVLPSTGQQWRHYHKTATPDTVFISNNGAEPVLDPDKLRFAETDGREILGDYHVNQPLDYHIKVIGGGYAGIDGVSLEADDMSFEHQHCTPPSCGFDADKGQFMLHVKTCSLTIKKTMPDNPHQSTPGESFVYTVVNDNDWAPVTLQVAAHTKKGTGDKIICESVTLKGLPVGTYTVTEDKTWSWRYREQSADCTLSPGDPDQEVTITNVIDSTKTKWLSYDYYLENRWDAYGKFKQHKPS